MSALIRRIKQQRALNVLRAYELRQLEAKLSGVDPVVVDMRKRAADGAWLAEQAIERCDAELALMAAA